MSGNAENRRAVSVWAEDWIMEHLNGEDGKMPTRDAWLEMLRSGKMTQCDKIARRVVGIKDEKLRGESETAFGDGLAAAGVAAEDVRRITSELFTR